MVISLITTDYCSLGIRSISSYVKRYGFETQMFFMNTRRKKYSKKILRKLESFVEDSELIAISSRAISINKAIQLNKYLSKLDVPVVLGGSHATCAPYDCLKEFEIVCIGEGEEAMLDLVRRIKDNKNIYSTKNFWFKKNNKIIKNPVRPLIANLDDIPLPDYDSNNQYTLSPNEKGLIKLDSISLPLCERQIYYQNTAFIFGTRGCPFNCTYCINSSYKKIYKKNGKIIRIRSTKSVIEEIRYLRKQFPKLKQVDFFDDDFLIRDIEEIKKFSEDYKKNVGMPFVIYGTPRSISDGKIKLLMKAGLKTILVGVQSGSAYVNNKIYKRNINKNQIIESSKILHKYLKSGVPPIYDLIINNPLERKCDILDTINLLFDLPTPFIIASHSLVLFPGSKLYNTFIDRNILSKADLATSSYNYHDLAKHFRFRKKNIYLNSLLYWSDGMWTERRCGIIPRIFFPLLLNKKLVNIMDKLPYIVYSLNLLLPTRRRIQYLIPTFLLHKFMKYFKELP